MAIVKMKRLTLLAMDSDRERIYDALVKCNSVQLKRSAEIPNCRRENPSATLESILEKINRTEEAIHYLTEQTELFNVENKKSKVKAEIPKNSFARPLTELDFEYFLGFGEKVAETEGQIDGLYQLKNQLAEKQSQRAAIVTEWERLSLLKDLPHPTTWYQNTESTLVQLSQMPASEWENLLKLAEECQAVDVEKVCEVQGTALVVAVAHKTAKEFFDKAAACGMVKCSVVCQDLPRVKLDGLADEIAACDKEIAEIKGKIVSYDQYVPQWKIYVDYLGLCAKKAEADGGLQKTFATFVLEAYYPAESEEAVNSALSSISDCMVLTFHEIGEDEPAPTLTRNNGVVRQFEFVTDMYTSPDYHEVDPNPVMSVFYFLIFGFMVADMGYGLVLSLAGLFAAVAIRQKTGLKTLLQLFGICGIAAIGVGALFGSFFSYELFPGLIPNPAQYPMVMMILSLILGIVHIMAGIGCNMAVKIKHKQALSAWLVDFPWIIVFVSFVLAILNMALDMAAYEPYEVLRLPENVSKISLYVCLGALAVALVFAGLGQKGILNKLMKSFGSAYGIINYFSDIMSYIRVFGLMLSSALMGTVVNQLGEMVRGDGGVGYVFAILVLVFAHLFNLVMGVLGVYIHNGRLQYVEFFGKFYTGDGQLFVPFGSDTKYTLVQNPKPSKKQ